MQLWRLSTGELLHSLSDPTGNHTDKITCLALRGGFLASGARDGRIKLWDVRDADSPECLTTMPAVGEGGVGIQGVAITRTGNIISVATGDEYDTEQVAGHHQLTHWVPMPKV